MATINLSDKLTVDLQNIVSQSREFADVTAYVTYIMEQVVTKKQQPPPKADAPMAQSYSKADEDKIRERLKNLGYLD